jgi:hypothetical protein
MRRRMNQSKLALLQQIGTKAAYYMYGALLQSKCLDASSNVHISPQARAAAYSLLM